MIIPEVLDTSSIVDLGINDFIAVLNVMADKAEVHPVFQKDVPEFVSKAPELRQLATDLGKARDAAGGGDRDRKAERTALWEGGKLKVLMNAQYLTMVSIHRNDPSILLNTGFDLKHKSSTKSTLKVLDFIPEIFLKHGKASGSVYVIVKRIKYKAAYELQMTDQDPSNESAWITQGIHSKARIVYSGQEPAKRLHFRARYHDDGASGRWCSPASIIIL